MTDLVDIAQSDSPVESVLAGAAARREEIIAVLPQLDAMNSFVRSDAHRESWTNGLTKVVYHYKREALRELTSMQAASHRLISIIVKCRDCGGSGRYTDGNGYTHDHCWDCANKGRVKLRFIESTLPGPITWHSPERDSWSFTRLSTAEMTEHAVADWTVHQKGNDLTPAQVAANMNAIEAVFTNRPRDAYNYQERSLHHTYTIYVGCSESDVCLICGGPSDRKYRGHLVRTGRLHWHGTACKKCDEQAHGAEIFETLSRLMPAEFLTPEVRAWAERHPAPPEKKLEPSPVVMIVTRRGLEHAYPHHAYDSDIPF